MTKLIKLDQADKDIIDYIKTERIKKGITQTRLAEMAGINLSVIGGAESYRQKYGNLTLKKLLKTLDLEPPEETGLTEKITSQQIDLFPYAPSKFKIKLLISDKFIDNIEDLKLLHFKNKGKLLINEREFSDPFIEDFKKNSQDYYAVVINDDSLLPIALKGDYLIIKYLYNFNYSDLRIKLSRKGVIIPKMFVLAKPDGNKLIRYVNIIYDSSYKENLFYAFLYLSEKNGTDKYAHIGSDFYFKENEIKIIGEVIAAIPLTPEVKLIN